MEFSVLSAITIVWASLTCAAIADDLDIVASNWVDPKIFGGDVSRKPGRYAVYIHFDDDIIGTGSMITRRFVLTAASVFDNTPLNDGRFYRVLLGDFNRNDLLDGQQQILACNIILHPDYDSVTKENNVALIRLQRAANLNRNGIELVPKLQFVDIDFSVITSATDCVLIGYGEDENGDVNVRRQRVDVSIVAGSDCSSLSNFDSDNNLCVQTATDEGPCNKDDGSPIMCTIDGKFTQVGILSAIDSCSSGRTLDTGTYVRKYRRFIKQTIREINQGSSRVCDAGVVPPDPLGNTVCGPAGTAFMTGFIYPDPGNSIPMLLITTSAASTTTVTLDASTTILNQITQTEYTVQASEGLNISLPTQLLTSSSGTGTRSLRVTSDNPIYLALSYQPNAIATTQVYPETCLQGSNFEYLVSSFPARGSIPTPINMIQINAIEDATTVQVQSGSTVLVARTLNQFDNFIYRSTTITGIKVVSTKAVSVFVGNNCAYVPNGFNYCDSIFQQVPPTQNLGRLYIIPALKPRRSFVVRAVATETDTDVVLRNNAGVTLSEATISAGQSFFSFNVQNQDVVSIQSSKDILVALYGTGGTYTGTSQGDPSMVYVPNPDEFLTAHSYYAQSTSGTHRVAIIIKSDLSIDDLTLNGDTSISSSVESTVTVLPGGISYDIHYVTLTDIPGPNTITNSQPFAAIFYLREFYREAAMAHRGIIQNAD